MTNIMAWDEKDSPPRGDSLHTARLGGIGASTARSAGLETQVLSVDGSL